MGPENSRKIVNLALQGGGSHGAFTWGVLDRLLEEERLSIDGITATSAGANWPMACLWEDEKVQRTFSKLFGKEFPAFQPSQYCNLPYSIR